MSISTIKTILGRVEVARVTSPIAVFKVSSIDGTLEAVFGATVLSQRRIKNKDPALVGVFDKSMPCAEVKAALHAAAYYGVAS